MIVHWVSRCRGRVDSLCRIILAQSWDDSCWSSCLKARWERSPLLKADLVAIDFLAKGVHSPKDAITRGMKDPPEASTVAWCWESFSNSPVAAATPAVWVALVTHRDIKIGSFPVVKLWVENVSWTGARVPTLVLLVISVACWLLTVTRSIYIEEGMVLCFILSFYTKPFDDLAAWHGWLFAPSGETRVSFFGAFVAFKVM